MGKSRECESLKGGVGVITEHPSEVLEWVEETQCADSFERPRHPAVEVGLQSGRGGERSVANGCLCESTAKILVLVLGCWVREGQYFGRQAE